MKLTSLVISAFCLSIALLLTGLQLRAQDENKTRFEISGQVMTDAGYNFQQINPDYFDVMRPTQLPAFKNEYGSNGNVFFGVRQSLFRVQSFTPTQYGELTIHFAFDLFGSGQNAGETNFHLLYAYAELGMLGAGRNWSLFSDIGGFPNMLEYWGPVGLSLCKNVQLRFIPLNGKNRLAFALEQPGASADEGVYADRIELSDVKPRFNLPDFAAEFRMTRNWGYAEIAGVLRKIEWIDQGNEPYDLSGKAWGYGLNLSSNLKLNENNVLLLQTIGGKGIQNLMNDAPTDIGIKNDFSNTLRPVKGVALPLFSYSCYLNHRWNEKWSTAAGWSAIHTQNSDGQQDDAFRNGRYASINLLYTPLASVMAGVELQWIERENYNDGWTSSATKVQFSLRYVFSEKL
ncbi:DcaP family trimeric outer membrane transporter [uncultured Draconibacterium sp.]|uniref:DcaP family trimeric outer membrane transporter n=1 Tax=uncultured Draconibacterium sp. TaxID=1573823 RepID=UPI0029C8AFA2|nr:DcaP family trimeric outer membrane transporter [uncultured Draconibacterium sp.]